MAPWVIKAVLKADCIRPAPLDIVGGTQPWQEDRTLAEEVSAPEHPPHVKLPTIRQRLQLPSRFIIRQRHQNRLSEPLQRHRLMTLHEAHPHAIRGAVRLVGQTADANADR